MKISESFANIIPHCVGNGSTLYNPNDQMEKEKILIIIREHDAGRKVGQVRSSRPRPTTAMLHGF